MNQPLLKTDAQGFHDTQHILRNNRSLGSRAYWLDYLFHFTDVNNVRSILQHGSLFSRAEAERRKLNWVDAANRSVISSTELSVVDFVRLYFRPKTPTAFHNEGIRPQNGLFPLESHCPIPVYLVFDQINLLTLQGTQFSDGNLARAEHNLYNSADEFSKLPFEHIYHDAPLYGSSADQIKNRRHSEVVIPKYLNMLHLHEIVCRSSAEFETLRNLLSDDWNNWKQKIRPARYPERLFNLKWLHVATARLSYGFASLHLHPPKCSNDCGPFMFNINVKDNIIDRTLSRSRRVNDVSRDLNNYVLSVDLSELQSSDYTLELRIDGNLAYLGKYEPEIPF